MSDNATFFRLLESDKRARAAEAENARLKSRLAVLERGQRENDKPTNGDDKPPGVPAEDDDESEYETDPKTGKRRKKVKAEDQEDACPDKPRTEDQEEKATKAAALMIVNCHRRSLGLPLVSRLIQDESAIPVALVSPHDSEAFAKCVIGAFRKAKGLPPLAPVPNGDGPAVPYDGSQSCAGLTVYRPGDVVTLDDDEAARLIGLGIVEASP